VFLRKKKKKEKEKKERVIVAHPYGIAESS